MATFVLIHGAGDSGWYWHLTEAELRARGHHTIAGRGGPAQGLPGTVAANGDEAPQVAQPGLDDETLLFPVPWSCRILVRWKRQLPPSGGGSSAPRTAAGRHSVRG